MSEPYTINHEGRQSIFSLFKSYGAPKIIYEQEAKKMSSDSWASLFEYENQALFVNSFTDGRLFKVLFEPTMRAFQLHANMSYTLQDKLNIIGGIRFKKSVARVCARST